MPELLEVEYYRRLAQNCVGRSILAVHAPDPWYLGGGISPALLTETLIGRGVRAARRHGKLLLLDLSPVAGAVAGAVLGLRFGMTGRLEVDGVAAIERLEYSTGRVNPVWERFGLGFADGGVLVVVDPRRLGRVSLDPDQSALGPEATELGLAGLRRVLAGSMAPIKARLLDQAKLAGLGNLLVDEILWRARLEPTRPAGGLADVEQRRLHRVLRATLVELDRRGGSHTGELYVARVRGANCPRCGHPLARAQVGGRTTFWCPHEQH